MSSYIPDKTIEEILESTDIIEVISEYVRLEKRGKNFMGLCPFHSEKTPSFNVSPEKKLFYCFGCGTGGDVITFLMKVEKYTFQETVETLAKRAGIQLSITNTNKRHSKNKDIYHVNEIAQRLYNYLLWEHESAAEAREYLKKRGIDKKTAQKFGLGYAPNLWQGLLNFLRKKGFSEELILRSGLISKNDKGRLYDRFRHRVIFPIYDRRGKIVGFGGRQLSEGKGPKYLNSPETEIFQKSKILYGFNWVAGEIRKKNQALIVEGYMDVIACHQFGFTNAVASLGTSFTEEHATLLKRNCEEVVIAYDGDAAGMAATLRGMNILQKAGCRVKILSLPEGNDPDDFLRKEGKEGFLKALQENTLSLIDYKLKVALQKYNIFDPEGKAKALEFIINDLAVIENAVERQHFIQKIALRLQISENALLEELSKTRKLQKFGTKQDKKENIRHNTKETLKSIGSRLTQSEKILLKNMLENEKVFIRVKEEIGFSPFNEQIRKILQFVNEELEKTTHGIAPAMLFNKLKQQDEKMAFFISSILAMEENFPISIEECIKNVKLNYLQRQEQELLKELSEAEQKNDSVAVTTLIRQLNELQKNIQYLKEKTFKNK
ncbi:MAG: primase [Clostridia bacterium]|jgi:DNA primase|nr:primase [Clostridiales bacterium]MDK2984963.1 primase [Clostridia bacterium]